MGKKEDILYVRADAHVISKGSKVRLGEVCHILGGDTNLRERLKNLVVFDFSNLTAEEQKQNQVFSILYFLEQIQKEAPSYFLENIGETDIILEMGPMEKPRFENVKLVILGILLFFGAMFSIMAFNNDISIKGVFDQFYWVVTGKEKPVISVLEIGYSIGLMVGILVFFNHVGKKKLTKDETPLQVELRKHENELDTAFIANVQRKGKLHDVD